VKGKPLSLRLLIAAVSLSIFAEGMWAVVMTLQVIALDDDPTSLSLVATCLGVGLVAFVLVGGLAAGRFPRGAIIIGVKAGPPGGVGWSRAGVTRRTDARTPRPLGRPGRRACWSGPGSRRRS